jgi:hypothetical protein
MINHQRFAKGIRKNDAKCTSELVTCWPELLAEICFFFPPSIPPLYHVVEIWLYRPEKPGVLKALRTDRNININSSHTSSYTLSTAQEYQITSLRITFKTVDTQQSKHNAFTHIHYLFFLVFKHVY